MSNFPAPDPDVDAELVLNGVHTDAAPLAQLIASHMGIPVSDVAADLGMFFGVVADLKANGVPDDE